MPLSFLTPLAALFALSLLLPLAVFVRRERRAALVRRSLGLPAPTRSDRLSVLAPLLALPLLAGVAAAQPVLDLTEERRERVDAEGYVVLDTSRSMLASSGAEGRTRLERARALTLALRDALPDVPLGLASLTDRTLPHLFPTTDRAVFGSALALSIEIEQPPPRLFFAERATELDALAAVFARNFFSPEATTRLLVVLTDGETRAFPTRFAAAAERAQRVRLVLVPVWARGEQVFVGGAPEPAYEADPGGPATLARLAEATGARVVPGESPGRLAAAVQQLVGEGPTRVAAREGREIALMPWVTAAALLPLGLVLRRRNL